MNKERKNERKKLKEKMKLFKAALVSTMPEIGNQYAVDNKRI